MYDMQKSETTEENQEDADRGKRGPASKRSTGGTSNRTVNKRIRAREARVIDPEGRQLGIMPRELAMSKAFDMQMDPVEVSPEAQPPVCRIMDYGKFKYAQK